MSIQSSIFGLLLLICFMGNAVAETDDSVNPIGCLNTGYQYKLKTLKLLPGEHGPKQTMYFFYNFRDEPVTLYQMRSEDSSRSLYVNHTILAHNWSVLAANENVIRFICSIPSSETEYGDVVDCEQSIKVCQNTQVRFGLNNKGNFWLANSNSKNEALRQVVHYGIIP